MVNCKLHPISENSVIQLGICLFFEKMRKRILLDNYTNNEIESNEMEKTHLGGK